MMFLGAGEERRQVDTYMRFYDLKECLYYAENLAKRYGNHDYNFVMSQDRVILYCVPEEVNPELVRVY